MATNFVSMANKLKLMIEQVRVQSEAFKDNAVMQAKIQAENDKAEAITFIRRARQFQNMTGLSLIEQHQPVPQAHAFSVQAAKVCQNCGRDAFLECTGCYRVYYCSAFCQQKDWLTHKQKCREEVEATGINSSGHVSIIASEK